MERFYILLPALIGVAVVLLAFAVYSVRYVRGHAPAPAAVKHNQVFGPFFATFAVWLIGPIERALLGRVSANAVTTGSLLACLGAGLAAAMGWLATAAWLYTLGGILDLIDGRLARATGVQSPAGALYDSVSDRWAELAVFTGYAWYLRESYWLLAVMAATSASMMVSYTRARGEGLGLTLSGGAMQRAERIILVGAGTMVAAMLAAAPSTEAHAPTAVGIALAVCAVTSGWTALGRWLEGYRALQARDGAARRQSPTVAPNGATTAAPSGAPIVAPNGAPKHRGEARAVPASDP